MSARFLLACISLLPFSELAALPIENPPVPELFPGIELWRQWYLFLMGWPSDLALVIGIAGAGLSFFVFTSKTLLSEWAMTIYYFMLIMTWPGIVGLVMRTAL